MLDRLGSLFRARGEDPDIVPSSGWQAWLTTLAAMTMSFLAVLAVAAGLAAHGLAEQWRTDLADVATVVVGGTVEDQDARVARVIEVLRATPGVLSARALSEAEQNALLAPWLGDRAQLAELPVPRLIDVRFAEPGPDMAALAERLRLTAEDVRIDDHQRWRAPLVRAAAALERLAWAATALVTLAAAIMVALAARATLAGNAEVVRVIRLIGGEDAFIAGAFVGRLSLRAASGGLIGTVSGLLVIESLPGLGDAIGLGPGLAPGLATWALLVVSIPLAAALIARLTARFTIRAALGRML